MSVMNQGLGEGGGGENFGTGFFGGGDGSGGGGGFGGGSNELINLITSPQPVNTGSGFSQGYLSGQQDGGGWWSNWGKDAAGAAFPGGAAIWNLLKAGSRGLGNLPSDPAFFGTGGGGGSGFPQENFGMFGPGGPSGAPFNPALDGGGGGGAAGFGIDEGGEGKFGGGDGLPPEAPALDFGGDGFNPWPFGDPQELYNGFFDEAMTGFQQQLADPHELWRQMIPEMERTRDRNISQAISQSGLVGQRYSSSVQHTVGEIGMQTALAEDALLASLIAERDNKMFQYEIQAQQIATQRLDQMFQMAKFEQQRQDSFFNLAYQDWQQRSLGWLGLLLPGIFGIGSPQGQGTFQEGTGATPGLIDLFGSDK